MTRQVLADGVDARATVAALEDIRSVVDVLVDVWDPDAGQWRRLTLGEQLARDQARLDGLADPESRGGM